MALDTVTVMGGAVLVFPAASRARADRVCGPFERAFVSHATLYGEGVSSAPSGAPSRRNCTPATPVSSEAAAETATVPVTVALAVGLVRDTVGVVVSFDGVVAVAVVERAELLPATSTARTA